MHMAVHKRIMAFKYALMSISIYTFIYILYKCIFKCLFNYLSKYLLNILNFDSHSTRESLE